MPREIEKPVVTGGPFRLGEWLVEPSLNRLSNGDTTIQIELKMMDVLVCLAEHAGDLVERQTLIDTVWATEFISDNALTRAIAELRRTLGDDAKEPRYIETIHRRGYRLIAPVVPTAATVHTFPTPVAHRGDERSPYPGLSAFTEDDADFFFGREDEVSRLWRKITTRRLLAVIGPSGVGKSSLLRAGLIPAAPSGWEIRICQPGEAPFSSLARSLAMDFGDDPEAIASLFGMATDDTGVSVVSRWRDRHEHVLLIVDQFEELFTQNPPEIQTRFAELMGRIARKADVHVLLSMRDDFLHRCHEHEALAPVFDTLTPISVPNRDGLRRAVVEPAERFGFAFEDDATVDEMLEAVDGERGALPLLAFTAARLWDERDRDRRLLTRTAYDSIGGVHGALARHAEAAVAAIGSARLPIVREIFRNLVTAQGTRATREVDDLLSIFDDPETAREPLAALIDARLLTSYEAISEDGETRRTVEIVHESLLAAWPRLVRWQTQDADGVQLRDQLRQAARTWDEHDRSDDLLWTGSIFREFQVWRERYPGGLSELEEYFTRSTMRHAKRRKRRRRIAVAAVLLILAAATTFTTALWRRSARETRRAEAQKLIAMGQVEFEEYPTSALAHATRSLELADSEAARLLAMEALWEGPTAFIVNESPSLYTSFSPGMNWLAHSHDYMRSLTIVSRNGEQTTVNHPSQTGTNRVEVFFGGAEDVFASKGYGTDSPRIALWSASEGRQLATAIQIDEPDRWRRLPAIVDNTKPPRALFIFFKGDLISVGSLHIDGRHQELGEFRLTGAPGRKKWVCPDKATGEWLALVEGNEISTLWIGDGGLSDRRRLGRHEGSDPRCIADSRGRFFLTVDRSGGIKKWDPSGNTDPTFFKIRPDVRLSKLWTSGSYLTARSTPENGESEFSIWSLTETGVELLRWFDGIKPDRGDFDPVGMRLAIRGPTPVHRLWPLAAPAGSEPIVLRRGPANYAHNPDFSSDGRWLATNDHSGLIMWPLVRAYPAVIALPFDAWTNGVAFGPEGRFLATSAGPEVRVWPLVGPVPPAGHIVFEAGRGLNNLAVSPDGGLFAGGTVGSAKVWIGRSGEAPQPLSGAEEMETGTGSVSFSPDGRFIAAHDGGYDAARGGFHVWEVATRSKIAALHLEQEEIRGCSAFVSDGRLLTCFTSGVVAWDFETGEHEVLVEGPVARMAASDDGRRLLVTHEGQGVGLQDPAGPPAFFDLDTGEVTALDTHGLQVREMSIDKKGTIAVTGDSKGVVRVGPVTGEEPHLLLGHDRSILSLAIDPLGRWIASCSMDGTFRLWPMPDLSNPPLHTLPRDQLIAKLKTLTNLRVVHDESSPTGWTLTHDPFPGWAEVPEW